MVSDYYNVGKGTVSIDIYGGDQNVGADRCKVSRKLNYGWAEAEITSVGSSIEMTGGTELTITFVRTVEGTVENTAKRFVGFITNVTQHNAGHTTEYHYTAYGKEAFINYRGFTPTSKQTVPSDFMDAMASYVGFPSPVYGSLPDTVSVTNMNRTYIYNHLKALNDDYSINFYYDTGMTLHAFLGHEETISSSIDRFTVREKVLDYTNIFNTVNLVTDQMWLHEDNDYWTEATTNWKYKRAIIYQVAIGANRLYDDPERTPTLDPGLIGSNCIYMQGETLPINPQAYPSKLCFIGRLDMGEYLDLSTIAFLEYRLKVDTRNGAGGETLLVHITTDLFNVADYPIAEAPVPPDQGLVPGTDIAEYDYMTNKTTQFTAGADWHTISINMRAFQNVSGGHSIGVARYVGIRGDMSVPENPDIGRTMDISVDGLVVKTYSHLGYKDATSASNYGVREYIPNRPEGHYIIANVWEQMTIAAQNMINPRKDPEESLRRVVFPGSLNLDPGCALTLTFDDYTKEYLLEEINDSYDSGQWMQEIVVSSSPIFVPKNKFGDKFRQIEDQLRYLRANVINTVSFADDSPPNLSLQDANFNNLFVRSLQADFIEGDTVAVAGPASFLLSQELIDEIYKWTGEYTWAPGSFNFDKEHVLVFKDTETNNYARMFLVTTEGDWAEGYDTVPLLAFDQGMVIQKDLSVGGFIASNQGVVAFGHGLNSGYEPPKVWLSHTSFDVGGTPYYYTIWTGETINFDTLEIRTSSTQPTSWGHIALGKLLANTIVSNTNNSGTVFVGATLVPTSSDYTLGTPTSPWGALYANDFTVTEVDADTVKTDNIIHKTGSAVTIHTNLIPVTRNNYDLGVFHTGYGNIFLESTLVFADEDWGWDAAPKLWTQWVSSSTYCPYDYGTGPSEDAPILMTDRHMGTWRDYWAFGALFSNEGRVVLSDREYRTDVSGAHNWYIQAHGGAGNLSTLNIGVKSSGGASVQSELAPVFRLAQDWDNSAYPIGTMFIDAFGGLNTGTIHGDADIEMTGKLLYCGNIWCESINIDDYIGMAQLGITAGAGAVTITGGSTGTDLYVYANNSENVGLGEQAYPFHWIDVNNVFCYTINALTDSTVHLIADLDASSNLIWCEDLWANQGNVDTIGIYRLDVTSGDGVTSIQGGSVGSYLYLYPTASNIGLGGTANPFQYLNVNQAFIGTLVPRTGTSITLAGMIYNPTDGTVNVKTLWGNIGNIDTLALTQLQMACASSIANIAGGTTGTDLYIHPNETNVGWGSSSQPWKWVQTKYIYTNTINVQSGNLVVFVTNASITTGQTLFGGVASFQTYLNVPAASTLQWSQIGIDVTKNMGGYGFTNFGNVTLSASNALIKFNDIQVYRQTAAGTVLEISTGIIVDGAVNCAGVSANGAIGTSNTLYVGGAGSINSSLLVNDRVVAGNTIITGNWVVGGLGGKFNTITPYDSQHLQLGLAASSHTITVPGRASISTLYVGTYANPPSAAGFTLTANATNFSSRATLLTGSNMTIGTSGNQIYYGISASPTFANMSCTGNGSFNFLIATYGVRLGTNATISNSGGVVYTDQAIQTNSYLHVNTGAHIGGTLGVVGNIVMTGAMAANGGLSVAGGGAGITGTLGVSGNATINGALGVNAGLAVTGDMGIASGSLSLSSGRAITWGAGGRFLGSGNTLHIDAGADGYIKLRGYNGGTGFHVLPPSNAAANIGGSGTGPFYYWDNVYADHLNYKTNHQTFDMYDDLDIVKQWGKKDPKISDKYNGDVIPPAHNIFEIFQATENGTVIDFIDPAKIEGFALSCIRRLAEDKDAKDSIIVELFGMIETLQNKVNSLEVRLNS